MPPTFTDLELLQALDRDGHLARVPCKPADKPALYQRLLAQRLVRKDQTQNGPNFWRIAEAGRKLLNEAILVPTAV